MADKIVQLQNEDGDNIFPICRGLGNGTVTNDAIDWSTMGGTDYISQCTTLNFSLDASSYLIKYPNGLVVFYITGNNSATFQTGGSNCVKFPSGFAGPAEYTFFAGSNPWASAACNFAIYTTNGTTYLRAYPLANRNSGTRFDVAGCYFASA